MILTMIKSYNSMIFDLLDMAKVSFCWFGILASVREDF